MLLPWGFRPAPATSTPASASSSVNRSIAAKASAVGGSPFWLSCVAIANTITRIFALPVSAGLSPPH
ncbi:MAG: hypothetical protein Q8K11_11835 [Phenylobacterium sp.]|uniref:hypothetical protein n=1 Tax=Phenylobacterium sp. TaxID=1871053 RepID=UPI0027303F28|nr:hypothetical protein [Phenylobacterium sp.]MDP2010857.1 hypothetical protein [Phenylobacterium sp.]MDP3632395.1 hypothetical protein [Phenylobacterium sp.]